MAAIEHDQMMKGMAPVSWEYKPAIGIHLLRVTAEDRISFPPREFRYFWVVTFHETKISGEGKGYPTFDAALLAGQEAMRNVDALTRCGFVVHTESAISYRAAQESEAEE